MFRILDPRGRAGLGDVIAVAIGCLAAATPLMVIIEIEPSVQLVRASLVGLWLLLALMSITAIRRVHNSDENLGWAFLIVGGPTTALLGTTLRAAGTEIPSWLNTVGALVAVAFATLGTMATFGMTSSGPNRFGADPEAKPAGGRAKGYAKGPEEIPCPPRQVFDPRGRTSRAGFVAELVLPVICAMPLIGLLHSGEVAAPWAMALTILAFGLAAVLLLFASVRRAHDIGASARLGLVVGSGPLLCTPMLLMESMAVVPAFFVGGILTLCLLAIATFDGEPRPNRYGPDPVRNRPPPKPRGAHSEEFLKMRRKMRSRAASTALLTNTDEPGFSKLGGDPDLPAGMAWPSNARGSFSLLAQIDLA